MIKWILLLAMLIPIAAWAEDARSIHVEWGYTSPSEPEVTGFKLYQEGIAVCQVLDPSATAMDCEVTLTATTTNFTLTATFADDTESPHSAPFAFTTGDEDSGNSGEPPVQDAPNIVKFGKIAPSGGRRGWVGLQ